MFYFLFGKRKTEDACYKDGNLPTGGTPKTQELIQDRGICWSEEVLACTLSTKKDEPYVPSLIAGPQRTHPESQNECASETGTEMKSVEAEMKHTQRKGLRGDMDWKAYKTMRLKEDREKNNSGRQEGGQRQHKRPKGLGNKKSGRSSQDVKFPCQNTQLTKPAIVTDRKKSKQIAGSLVKKWKV